MKKYEGMFLIDSKETKKGPTFAEEQIGALIAKCNGEVVRVEKWDERKLAYEIDGITNGSYFLYYFTGEPDTISALNREIKLSPHVLRALFLKIKEVPELVVREERTEAPHEAAGTGGGDAPASEPEPKPEAEQPAEETGETVEKTE